MRKRRRKGFSLTEMVVVMGILLVLYSMVLIYVSVLTRSKARIQGIVTQRNAVHESFLPQSSDSR